MSFSIEVDPATFQASASTLTGEIWIDVEGHSFPADHWNDFVVVILGWWLGEAASLVSFGGQATFRFMDGPWWFEVDASSGSEWQVSLVDGHGNQPSVVHAATVSSAELVKALRRAASAVERRCQELGWSSSDLEVLRRNRDSLKASG